MIRILTGILVALVVSSSDAADGAAVPVPGRDFVVPGIGLTMIWVAPGSFVMRDVFDAGDETEVTLTRGYWLGRTEVTQAHWQAVNPLVMAPSKFRGGDLPVEQVNYENAMDFCQLLGERETAAGRLPAGYRFSLPTEAQWEYACRAGSPGPWAGDIEAIAWYDRNSDARTQRVAQKQPNAWGFFDMHGNVAEWCANWYHGYPGGQVDDPAGPLRGVYRVFRGGHWSSPAGLLRSDMRVYNYSFMARSTLGFRLALVPVGPLPAITPPASVPALTAER